MTDTPQARYRRSMAAQERCPLCGRRLDREGFACRRCTQRKAAYMRGLRERKRAQEQWRDPLARAVAALVAIYERMEGV